MSEPRRFLIATAVSHYPHAPEWDRPGLVEARRKMVDLFTGKLGYEHVSDLGANPTQHQLLRELREFCRAEDRRPDDIVAVYIAGHGERLDNEEYVLLTSDTNPDDLYDALQPGQLARKILAGTKVRRLLLMLDTCYSGQGGNEVLASMAKLKSNWREKDAGLALITSAQPNELAQTGAFPELLTEAVTSLATAGYTPQLLSLDAVVNATRSNPKRPDFQHIGLEIIGLTGEIPPFLPNAKHSPRLSHTDMALQQAAEWDEQDERRDVEFRTRLLRRAMGHSDLATGRPLGDGMPNKSGPVSCTVLGDRVVSVSCSDEKTLQIRDLLTGQLVGRPMTGHTGFVNTVVCAQLDGRPVAVSGSWDNTVRIWDLQTSRPIDVIHVPGQCIALALDETGLLICSFGSDVGVFRRH